MPTTKRFQIGENAFTLGIISGRISDEIADYKTFYQLFHLFHLLKEARDVILLVESMERQVEIEGGDASTQKEIDRYNSYIEDIMARFGMTRQEIRDWFRIELTD